MEHLVGSKTFKAIISNNATMYQITGPTGQLAQSLDSNTATTCSNATAYLAAANTGIVVAIIMIVVGIALTLSGALLRKETTKTEQYNIPSTQPCKACGQKIKWNQDSVVEEHDIWHTGCYPKTVKS